MDAPPVQYVRTSDGVSIAYMTLGSGPPVVFAGGIYGDAFFYRKDWLPVRRLVDRVLEAGWRVVLYDIRGMGASDSPVEALDLDARVRDLEAVVEATGLSRFVLASLDHGGVTAIAYAARHPDTVSRLALFEPWATGTRKFVLSPTRLTISMDPGTDDWTIWTSLVSSIITGFRDHELGQQLAGAIKESTTPAQLAAYFRATEQIDVTDLLSKVTAPALVTHFPDSPIGILELARDVASGLKNARFLVTDTASYWPAMRDFLREDQPGTGADDTRLSSREMEVLRLLAGGRSNQQIADELVISLNTVRRHVSNIFDKTGVANRAQAAVYARDHGLA